MKDEEVKKVRIYLIPKKDKTGNPIVTVPKQLNDPILKTTVELNPDGEISETFADGLLKTYDHYALVDPGTKIPALDEYLRNESYREPEIAAMVDNMTPNKKDVVYAFCKMILEMPEAKAVKMAKEIKKHPEILDDKEDDEAKIPQSENPNLKTKESESTLSPGPAHETGTPPAKTLDECLVELDVYIPADIAQLTGMRPVDVGKQLSILAGKGFVIKDGETYKPTPEYKKTLEELKNADKGNNSAGN